MRQRQNEIIAQLNDLIQVVQPNTPARLTKASCRLNNWEFWNDNSSIEHIQFTAYKARQKLKRADEEEQYTQREILSSLDWCQSEYDKAYVQHIAKPRIDQTCAWTSEAFYARKLQITWQRRDLWERILRPHLTLPMIDVNAVD